MDVPLPTLHPRDVAVPIRAVVHHEEDDRVLGQPERQEAREEPPNVFIDVRDHREDARPSIEVGVVGQGVTSVLREAVVRQVDVTILGQERLGDVVKRSVRGVGGDVREEVLACCVLRLDPVERPIEVDVRTVAAGLNGLPVVEEDGVGVLPLAPRRVGRLADAAAAVNERFFESLVDGAHRIRVAEVPLAEDPGPVAGAFEDLCQGHLLGLHHGPPDEGVDGAGAVVVPAGHERGPRRGTDRADVELRHPRAAARHGVEVWRADDGVAVHAQVAEALVVGHDEDHAGARRGLRRAGAPGRHADDKRRHGECANGPPAHRHRTPPFFGSAGMRQGTSMGTSRWYLR